MEHLPFEMFRRIVVDLNLEEVIRLRAVSRQWCFYVDHFTVTTLCLSDKARGHIFGKQRLISGKFEQNFIKLKPSKLQPFFDCFGRSIFVNLKHLRVCGLSINHRTAAFAQILNSFGQLQSLSLINVTSPFGKKESAANFKLNLANLRSIEFEKSNGIRELTLDAPALSKIKHWNYGLRTSLKLKLVHAESVEWLVTDCESILEVAKLKNLQYLYSVFSLTIGPTFLSSLEKLKEIHLDLYQPAELYGQIQKYGRTDLKIYRFGFLVDCPNDPIKYCHFEYFNKFAIDCYVHNFSRLADEILYYMWWDYEAIEESFPEGRVNIWSRFVRMNDVRVSRRVQNVQKFLNFLKSFDNIEALRFSSKQPQDLFNQLPDYCSVQKLRIVGMPEDFDFLFKLHHLIELSLIWCKIDDEFIRRIFGELKFLMFFDFHFNGRRASISLQSKLFRTQVKGKSDSFDDLNDAIQFILS